ncbi:MAG: hypothetical protein HYZ69_03690 [Candidatus Colwellbacteria bacterium]|nr:hypothetical protein [Candidatus Colwellbacteria bacterium]
MYDPTKPYKDEIVRLIKSTWTTKYVSVRDWLMREKFAYPVYRHVDGIGTKGIYHWQARSFFNAVRDAMAMNVNDLALIGATPFEITDHVILPEDDHDAFIQIVKHLVGECKARDIAITGGESSVHDTQDGMELSISITGFVETRVQNMCKEGDVLIGIESSGPHSNGFSKIRKLFPDELRKEFITPTYVYIDSIRAIKEKEWDEERRIIHGMAHITGGAFTKMKGMLSSTDAILTHTHSLAPHHIFSEIYEKGVSDEEMYFTFNCGIGFIMSVAPRDADYCLNKIRNSGKHADIIGEIKKGSGKVKIQSMFSKKKIVF